MTAVIVIVESIIAVKASSGMLTSGVALFGAGGVVAFNIGRLLTMFNKVIENVFVNDSHSTRGAGSGD